MDRGTIDGDAGAPPPGPAVVRWGLGDFFWIWFAGLVASIVLGAVGLAVEGRTGPGEEPGAVGLAFAAAGQFGVWTGLVVALSRWKGRGSPRLDFGLRLDVRAGWAVLAGVGLFFVATALIAPLVLLADESQQVVEELKEASGAELAVYVLLALVLAPVGEELMFRGLLLRALRRRMAPAAAVGVQALAFALVHPLLSQTLGDLAVVPALFVLGAVSGVVAERRGDLSASILLHVGFNLVTTVTLV